MHYEQVKHGFAPIRDFGFKNGTKAFSFIDRRNSQNKAQNYSEKDEQQMHQQDREIQADLS